MPVNRFFIDSPLKVHEELSISDEEFEHMRVLRVEEGEECELVNGKNQLGYAQILTVEKKRITLRIDQVEEKKPPLYRSILALGTPKIPKLEFVLEKGTELGVTEFWLFPAELSEKHTFSASQKQRQKHILTSALKQCGRLDLPKLLEFDSLADLPQFEGELFFGDTRPGARPPLQKHLKDALFFIGPEKGFTGKEILQLQSLHNAKEVKLAPYILRTETAAITAAALMTYLQA